MTYNFGKQKVPKRIEIKTTINRALNTGEIKEIIELHKKLLILNTGGTEYCHTYILERIINENQISSGAG